ncbi:MAG: hypothetical protein HY683_03190 [Chloroflexi bacterium]|nr:hypothetical protein [Chloroflexota bacterium]
MLPLRLRALVPAPRAEVFAFVTLCGNEGPLDEAAFTERYGTVLERQGNEYRVREPERHGQSEVTWRCLFEYPSRREMEALGSSWADRIDTFEEAPGGTLWTVTWRSKVGLLRGLIHWFVFSLRIKVRQRRLVVEPVLQHFSQKGPQGAGA